MSESTVVSSTDFESTDLESTTFDASLSTRSTTKSVANISCFIRSISSCKTTRLELKSKENSKSFLIIILLCVSAVFERVTKTENIKTDATKILRPTHQKILRPTVFSSVLISQKDRE
jgi:hypothetical protein